MKKAEEEEEEEEEDVSAKGMSFEKQRCYNYDEIWCEMRVHCEFPKGNKQKGDYSRAYHAWEA
jgi:hypothetical protein